MGPDRKPLAKPVAQPAASPYRQRVTRASYRVEVIRSQHGDVTRVQYSLRDGTAVHAPPPPPPPPPTPAASGAPEDSSESEASEAANAEAEGSGSQPGSEADAPAESVDSVSEKILEEESDHAAGSDSEGNTSDEGSGRESGSNSEDNSKSPSSEEATSNGSSPSATPASDDPHPSDSEENEIAEFSDDYEEVEGGGPSISSAGSVPNLPQPHNTPDDGQRGPSSGRAPSPRESHRYGPYVPYVPYEFDNRSDEERRAFPRRAWRTPSRGPSNHAGPSGWRRSPSRARSEPSVSDILRERRSASREAVQALPAFVAAAWEHAESGNDPATAEGSGDDISESATPAGSDAGSAGSKVAASVGWSDSDSDDSTCAPSSSDGSDGSELSTDASSVSSSSSEGGDEDEEEKEEEKKEEEKEKETEKKEEGDANSGGASSDNGRSTRSGAPGPSTTSSGASSTSVKRGREEEAEDDEQEQSTRAKRVRVANLLAPVEHDPLPLELEPIPFATAAFVTIHSLDAEVEVWEEEIEQRRLDAANAYAEAYSEDVMEIEAEEREEAVYRAAEGGWRFDDAHFTGWFNSHLVERVRYHEAAEHYDYAASVLARLEAARDAAAPSLEHFARLRLVAARHELGSVEWHFARDQMSAAVRAAFLDAANAINNHPRTRW